MDMFGVKLAYHEWTIVVGGGSLMGSSAVPTDSTFKIGQLSGNSVA
jgi:hypothetical protein